MGKEVRRRRVRFDGIAMALGLTGVTWAGIIVALICFLLCGCSSAVRYVPVETVRDRWHSYAVHDTIFESDSTVIVLGGDTIREYRWRDRWRTHFVHDTVAIHDSVPAPYPVPARLTRWEQAKVDWGGLAIGALAVAAIGLLLKVRGG